MAVITIYEKKAETGFNANLIIEGNSYPITVSKPFNTEQEEELEWYFENWMDYPMLDNVKADRAEASVKEYGEELFRQVFQSDSPAYFKYKELSRDLSQLTIGIVSINPEFQAIHWEALRDPELTHPLAIETILIRKSIQPKKIKIKVQESPTINLLVVVARPNAEDDIPHRTISRPLVETIREAKLRVNIEILRPGTYEALAKHLKAKGNGYYHIVHFDVHGGFKTYQAYKAGLEDEEYPYLQPRYGREDIQPYEGVKAFLAFEGNEIYQADPVEASEIANLLTSKDIPVCILNACQSGKQLNQANAEDNRETSLGSRLMNAGMQMVVAISYKVTVTAAEIMMQQLYEHLFDEQDINQAILFGRKELYNHKARKADYNTEIDLEDWLLPVVYSNGEVTFNLREFTPEEATEYDLNLKSKYKFVEPNYGFVGRDIDILLIEKRLLQHNILLLRGMGGTGKTTLLNYLREWWQVTKFAEDTFSFAYDRRGYNLQQIIFEISKQIYNQFDFECFQSKSLSEQCQKISQELRNKPYALILDNLESITGQPLAIQNTLEETEKAEIKNFLTSLVGGKTKVIIGSRIAEEWLEESTFQDNSYQLRGLDSQASSDLAANILQKTESNQSLDEINTDEHFQRLMKLLAGNPLAINVILPNLKDKSPKKVLEQLANAEIDPGGDDRESNLLKCIEYSYNNLSAEKQKLLLFLTHFKYFLDSNNISDYAKQLEKFKSFQDYNLEKLKDSVAEAMNWGLLTSIDNDNLDLLSIHPVFPYFLEIKIQEFNEDNREALEEGFKNHYQTLAIDYDDLMESNDSDERQDGIALVRLEYENLYQALQMCLEKQESILNILNCLHTYLLSTNDRTTKLQLLESTYKLLSNYAPEKHNQIWEEEIFGVLDSIAACYLLNQDYQKAEKIYHQTLAQAQQNKETEPRLKQILIANTYHNLGLVAQKLRKYPEAQDYYQQALNIKIEYEDRYSQADTYNNLGQVNQELRKYPEAQDCYQQALNIKIEYEDRYSQADIYHNLGYVAQELREYQTAQDYYQQALDIKKEYEDRYSQADTLHQFGILAEELRKFQQAQNDYKSALDIYIKYNDRHSQARIYNQLGRVAQELRKFQQAHDYYKKAFNIYEEYNDHFSQASVCHNLGLTLQKLRKYPEAQDYYQQALKIKKEYDDLYSQADTLHQLGRVAQELREYIQSQKYYLQALEIFIQSNDCYSQAGVYHNLGTVAQDLKKYPEAKKYYKKALRIKIKFKDKYSQGNSYGRLGMLAEELSKFKEAKKYYLRALRIFFEFDDEYYFNLTICNLASLYQKTQDNSILSEITVMVDNPEAEIREIFQNLTVDNR